MGSGLRVRLSRLGDALAGSCERHFHVRRTARTGFDESFFSIRGDVIFADHASAYRFLQALYKSGAIDGGSQLRASQLFAMGLIHEILHAVISLYRQSVSPKAFGAALEQISARDTLEAFVQEFPPPAVHNQSISPRDFLRGSTDGIPNTQWMLEEVILLWITNQNPGYAPIRGIVSDEALASRTKYGELITQMRSFFDQQPRFGPKKESLIDMLLAPIRHAPNSLSAQLEFMKSEWGLELSRHPAWAKLLGGLDFIAEEGRWFLSRGPFTPGDEGLITRDFKGDLYEYEPEQFSQDLDWMPRVVMLAKSTFVWLDQLSKKHRRPIAQLSDIPDEELDILASRGFTALWLIGLWKRSEASRRIKQLRGNSDAVASAYSLDDYEIAPDLGGESAYQSLKERAARRGIRLASDMVPNHMGVDSKWVLNHPDWFIQTRDPPFPSYSYNGPDLSSDQRVGIFIEDGYWNNSDAAVVFKRLDRWTGDARYIYHGNDGTSMPWNDTAQLDYLRADVREAVIQTILHVARKFPIIRFDAAMTLAKRHYQRLWFPQPGTGGGIPSRAQHGLSKDDFDRLFPVEFWREVVDRVAREVPNTLLLAEAFWLMEGYFVRTLGMHRVYNSAFMNMLRKEDNASYRLSVRNVLEFNPQILKRYVNFMNNPDEDTAVAQFGKDDKYFGICTMMCTMPGLPMFGHGQIEGFTEKYGMEYKRAYKDEEADGWLVDRHYREIFPLLKRRWLFSEVDNFYLYDFVSDAGHVDEDVFAYSNRAGGERTLVLFHNKFKHTRGTIRTSVGFLEQHGGIAQRSFADGMAVGRGDGLFTIFRDHVSGLEHIRENNEMVDRGFEIELEAFKYRVLWDFREVRDSEKEPYRELAAKLGRQGVPSIASALIDVRFRAIHAPFYEAINIGSTEYLTSAWSEEPAHPDVTRAQAFEVLTEKLQHLADGVAYFCARENAPSLSEEELAQIRARFERMSALSRMSQRRIAGTPSDQMALAWIVTLALGGLLSSIDHEGSSESLVRDHHLGRVLARAFRDGGAEGEAEVGADLLALVLKNAGVHADLREQIALLLDDPEASTLLGVHMYDGIYWFNKERYEDLVNLLAVVAVLEAFGSFEAIERERSMLVEWATESKYQLASLRRKLLERAPSKTPTHRG
jgi:glycosidase